jgi:hypothetical protein
VRRERRYGRQTGDRQRAFGQPLGRHGANDVQPVPSESAKVRTQGGRERHFDSDGESGVADYVGFRFRCWIVLHVELADVL